MSRIPLISVVVPAFNSARYLPRALNSLFEQSYSPLEIIVVDDGSTDDTVRCLEPFRDRIRYIYQANRGLPGARNTGICNSQGDFVGFLDADDWWSPDKLALQAPLLIDNERVGMVHSDFRYFTEDTGQYSPSEGKGDELVGDCYQRLFERNWINVCTALVRKECFEKAGLFDETIIGGLEDYDLWLRVSRQYEFAFVPKPLAVYFRHSTNMSSNRLRMALAGLRVAEKALVADPLLWERVGKREVNMKFFHLSYQAGCHYLECGDIHQGRRYLERSLEFFPGTYPTREEYFDVAYAYYERGLFREANRNFGKALQVRLLSPYVWAFWFVTFLPASFVRKLRRMKQQIGPAKNEAGER